MTLKRSAPDLDRPYFVPRKAFKRATNMASTFEDEPLPLPIAFAKIKADLTSGKQAAVTASWHLLIQELRREVELVAASGSFLTPTIDHREISDASRADVFMEKVRRRGAAVIRNVMSTGDALAWRREDGPERF